MFQFPRDVWRSIQRAVIATGALLIATVPGATETIVIPSSVGEPGSGPIGDSRAAALSANGRYYVFESTAWDHVPGDTNNKSDIFVLDRDLGTVTRVSVGAGGAQANDGSFRPAISADGRFVAFASDATNLVPGDTNNVTDIFVHDLQTGTTTRASVDGGGAQGTGYSDAPSISSTGRYIAFESEAPNLAPMDTNGVSDVFVRDVQLGSTVRVSVGGGGAQGTGRSAFPAISSDGRYVAFESEAPNLVASDTNGANDVFLRDVLLGSTARVSVDGAGGQGAGASSVPSISADGRFVCFQSIAPNLVPGDANGAFDAFCKDVQVGTTMCVSLNGNSGSYFPSISADGRSVAFHSYSSNLVPGDTNNRADVFVRDLQAGTSTRLSVDALGAQGTLDSFDPAISADGRFVVFHSDAANLVPGDTNGKTDVFIRDLQAGTIQRVSVNSVGLQGNDNSVEPTISADGRFVTFQSAASNLVPGDTNRKVDVFVYELETGITSIVSVNDARAQGNADSTKPSISSDGRYVAFVSTAANLVSGDTNLRPDVFVRDRLLGTTTRVSLSDSEAQANGASANPSISADGALVTFESTASNLVTGDTNGFSDIFVRNVQLGTTMRMSVDDANAQADRASTNAMISLDGRYVVFESAATNLASGDTNGLTDVFLRDRVLGTTTRVSVSGAGAQATGDSLLPSVSQDGRYVAFQSSATNLVGGDTNGKLDVFVRDRQLNTTTRASVSGAGVQGNGDSTDPSISADGLRVTFESLSTNLAAGDVNAASDVFYRDMIGGTTERVSTNEAGAQGNGESLNPSISADGRVIAFDSLSNNLTPLSTGPFRNTFVRAELLEGVTAVNGRLALQGYVGPLGGGVIDVELLKDGAQVGTESLVAGANGEFGFTPALAGRVVLKFQFRTGLVKSVPLLLGLAPLNDLMVTLSNGDCDIDNDVDIDDYDVLAGAYGSVSGGPEDLDGDGDVDIDDYDILAGSYGLVGE